MPIQLTIYYQNLELSYYSSRSIILHACFWEAGIKLRRRDKVCKKLLDF